MAMQTSSLSPMMAQWHACKQRAPFALLLFRLGDFYEAFYDDALLISRELDLTLTKRQEIPMCGVPAHTSESYVDRLVAKGHRVAIAEQMEDPRSVKGLVKREIVRVVTPGTLIASNQLSERANNFLVSVTQVNTRFGVATLDITTGEFRAAELETAQELADELCRLRPAELLLSERCRKAHAPLFDELPTLFPCALTLQEEGRFDPRMALEELLRHLHVHTLDGFGLQGMSAAITAAGALLAYVKGELALSAGHIRSIHTEHLSAYMAIDRSTERHLELVQGTHASLLSVLDRTRTPMGARLLKRWVLHPLLSVEEIEARQCAVDAFLPRVHAIAQILKEVRDLERLIMRVETGFASPRDLLALSLSLEPIAPLAEALCAAGSAPLTALASQLSDVSPVISLIRAALVDAPPLRLSDGAVFRQGFSQELDALQTLKLHSREWLARYQTQLRESTQIKTLKVSYTKAFGYYIEVSRGQADRMPAACERKQTLVNTERFTTPELKTYEQDVLTADARIEALEQHLFQDLRRKTAAHAPLVRSVASAVAQIDSLLSLADVAKAHRYKRPVVHQGDTLRIVGGRHPVVEAMLQGEAFIPNDTLLDTESHRLVLLTGPNMAGKSTFIRQVALIVIMAHMGSFVPAESAHIGVVDRVFSRIGASDNLSRGQSTFMVEMAETAAILHSATPRSLVVLDEIGRGTSTYDGVAIAWAVADHLLTLGAKTLFATHYWELTELEEQTAGAVNYHVAVHEGREGVVFLHKIVRGGTDKSYGIHVAQLAGLPAQVLRKARAILAKLEKQHTRPVPRVEQPDFFSLLAADPRKEALWEAVQAIDLDRITPLEALHTIASWKRS
jgi:DNA mismatch repair protein MutS